MLARRRVLRWAWRTHDDPAAGNLRGPRLIVVGQGPSFEVLVVGGGLAGSSMAITLAREGVDVLLVERERVFRDRVRG